MKPFSAANDFLLLAAMLPALLPALLLGLAGSRSVASPDPVWGSKPVLAYILLEPDKAGQLQAELELSPAQRQFIVSIAEQEEKQRRLLEAESQAMFADPTLSRADKIQWVADSGYNQRLHSLLRANQQALAAHLGAKTYPRLVAWIEQEWARQANPVSEPAGLVKVLARLIPPAAKTYPRSFEVYATRYDAGERKIVALPDKCLKFANGSALRCDGYDFGQGYSVAISYEGNLVVALVGESGPWNVDDNYWAKTSDPQPRRMFADLPLGVPEVQAAYFDGYNGGLDQFGRTVTSPVAIDISKALAADLGLGPGNNQVTVSFLWTEGWDAVQPQPANPGNSTAPSQPAGPAAVAWQTVVPNPDGSVIHIVQSGQTLVGIAAVYNLPLADLLALNGLTMQSIIQPGDRIVVKPADPTRTPAATASPTAKPSSSPASTPTPTDSNSVTLSPPPGPTPSVSPTPAGPALDTSSKLQGDWILVVILTIALVGAGLLAWGLVDQRRNN